MEHVPNLPPTESIARDENLEVALQALGLHEKAEVVVTKTTGGLIKSIYITDRGVTSTFEISTDNEITFLPGSLNDRGVSVMEEEIREVHKNTLRAYLQSQTPK